MRFRLAAVMLSVMAMLSACRVDTVVDIAMAEDGSGEVAVAVTVDAAVVAAAPELTTDLVVDDLVATGWTVEGPVATPDGGATITVRRGFTTPAEATSWLATLNGPDGPLSVVALDRLPGDRSITYSLSGVGQVERALASFADAELLALAGVTPYADALAEAGLGVDDALSVTVRAELPGVIDATSGVLDGDRIVWQVPTDGTAVELTATSTVSLERGLLWRAASVIALVLLIAWVLLSTVLIALVVKARRRRP